MSDGVVCYVVCKVVEVALGEGVHGTVVGDNVADLHSLVTFKRYRYDVAAVEVGAEDT